MSSEDLRLQRTFRHNPDVVSSRLGNAGVLVHLKTNRILELNVTGMRIWELVGEELPLEAIADRLRQEFDVAPAVVQVELQQLIGDLSREGLIDVADDGV
jgi:hypothetical protein